MSALQYDRDAIREVLLSSLGTVYDCTRTWSAWGHGTMGPDDFRPFDQQDDRIEEVVDAIVVILPQLPDRLIFSERLAISQTAQVSVDDECNRIIQATLDHIRSNYANPAVPAQAAAKCDGDHGGPRCSDPECWNDSPPASDQLKDNQIAALVNKVCRLAREFHNHDSLRQRIAQELVPALQAAPEPKFRLTADITDPAVQATAELVDEVQCLLRTLHDYEGNPVPINKRSAMVRAMQKAVDAVQDVIHSSAQATPEPVRRNDPLSALAIRILVDAGHVSQADADSAFTLACEAMEDEAQRMNVELPWVVRKAAVPEPVPMVLHCPKCFLQHIDAPDERTLDWKNEPHRSHLCHGCGTVWRPADVPTTGVKAISTKGKADTWEPGQPTQQAAGEPVEWQARANGSKYDDAWRKVAPTAAQPTVQQRVEYLRSLKRADGQPAYEFRALYTHPAPGVPEGLLDWAVSRWRLEVMNRPLVNIHRRTLDDTWRLVIRFAGGNPDELIGPPHDDLLAAAQAKGGAA